MSTRPAVRPGRPQLDLVGGRWSEPGLVLGTLADPNTGAAIGPQLATTAQQVEAALVAADNLHRSGDLARRTIEARAALLEDMAEGTT